MSASNVRILAFSGSSRRGSFNRRVLEIAASGARAAGAEVTVIDLRDLALPLYDGDLEAESGLPAGARQLKAAMMAADGFLVASPEYNSSFSPLLKNALDWASRPAPGEAPLAAFTGKAVALMSASPGALGGLRGLVHLRAMLGNINVLVIPEQVAVGGAGSAFAEDGSLKEPKQHESVRALGTRLAELLAKLKG